MRRVRDAGLRLPLAALVVIAVGLTGVGLSRYGTPRDATVGAPAFAAHEAAPDVQAQKVTQGGQVLGRVLINGVAVIEYLVNAAWYDGYERASIAATNIRKALEAGAASHHFHADQIAGYEAVMADGEKIITVDPADARYNGIPAARLARAWADNIGDAIARSEQQVPAPAPELRIEGERNQIGDLLVGDVLINDRLVMRFRTGLDRESADERAQSTARRLRDAVKDGYGPDHLGVGEHNGQTAILMADKLITYVDSYSAELNRSSQENLARVWAANIAGALDAAGVEGTRPIAPAPGPIAAPAGARPVEQYDDRWYAEQYGDKWVPILSVPDGIRIGGARVNGPKHDLSRVQAVAQIETPWENTLEIDIYVPISTKGPSDFLNRVQGVGVTALADFDLTDDGKPRRSAKSYSIFDPPKGRAKSRGRGLGRIF